VGKLWKRFIESLSPKKLGFYWLWWWGSRWVRLSFGTGLNTGWELLRRLLRCFLNEWAVIIGILCTVVTCLVNWYYERKKYLIALGGVYVGNKSKLSAVMLGLIAAGASAPVLMAQFQHEKEGTSLTAYQDKKPGHMDYLRRCDLR
jgi:hypothetical protein